MGSVNSAEANDGSVSKSVRNNFQAGAARFILAPNLDYDMKRHQNKLKRLGQIPGFGDINFSATALTGPSKSERRFWRKRRMVGYQGESALSIIQRKSGLNGRSVHTGL